MKRQGTTGTPLIGFIVVFVIVNLLVILLLIGLDKAKMEAKKNLNNASPRVLFNAIRQVETGGEKNEGVGVIGDDGNSIGPYQIGEPYWIDAYEHRPEIRGKWQDCLESHYYSEQVMLAYWDRWGATTNEEKARMHNGGPGGMNKSKTLDYWNQVKAHLK